MKLTFQALTGTSSDGMKWLCLLPQLEVVRIFKATALNTMRKKTRKAVNLRFPDQASIAINTLVFFLRQLEDASTYVVLSESHCVHAWSLTAL